MHHRKKQALSFSSLTVCVKDSMVMKGISKGYSYKNYAKHCHSLVPEIKLCIAF